MDGSITGEGWQGGSITGEGWQDGSITEEGWVPPPRYMSCSVILLTRIFLFFLWFPLCRGEADLLVTPKYGYFSNLLPLVPVVGLFSPFFSSSAFLSSVFTQSSHLTSSCGFPRYLEPS